MIYLVNGPLLVIVLVIAGAAFCTRKSPDAMRAIAAWLRATADADEAYARQHAEWQKQFRAEMGLNDKPKTHAQAAGA